MRPLYETPESLERESALAMSLEVLWGVKCRKLPIKYGLDFALIRDKRVIGFAELKSRNGYSSDELDARGGVFLSMDKLEHVARYTSLTGLPVFFVVELKDGIFACKFTDKPKFTLAFGGRSDRDDWQDVEPIGLISLNQFKKLDIVFRDKQPVAAE
jgi:hypothetical protein